MTVNSTEDRYSYPLRSAFHYEKVTSLTPIPRAHPGSFTNYELRITSYDCSMPDARFQMPDRTSSGLTQQLTSSTQVAQNLNTGDSQFTIDDSRFTKERLRVELITRSLDHQITDKKKITRSLHHQITDKKIEYLNRITILQVI